MKIKVLQSQVQKQILAPVMQQAIEVLLLPITDLNMAIEQELQVNPLLEINEERQREKNSTENEEIKRTFDDISSVFTPNYYGSYIDDEIIEDQPIKRAETLEENLLHELATSFSSKIKLRIGELIIGNIDEDGYLTITVEEIAKILGLEDLALIEEILSTIQHFEPLGIAARDLKECLLLQAKAKLGNEDNLVCKIIKEHIGNLGKKRFADIKKSLGASCEEIKKAASFIATLDPKPARNYRPIRTSIYIKPDVLITKTAEGEYQALINREDVPFLRINPIYKSMLEKNNLSDTEKDFIYEKMKNAINFMRSIEQRGQTIKRISQFILEKQRSFFDGDDCSLVPMTLKDVALSLERNESTISRAINNKYMDTPKGLFPLKFFFSQYINKEDNGSLSNRSAKEEVKNLINNEDKQRPLSDHDIVKIFEKRGTKIARRTITKYRKTLHILPTHLRKQ